MRYLLFAVLLFQTLHSETPEKAFQELKEGNARFFNDKSTCPDRVKERRLEQKDMQAPFAAIIGCADSRVAPEIIFDQGIGKLFVVRIAGNVVGPMELESLRYSVDVLKSSIIVVLGHESCGAVSAVAQGKTSDIKSISELIQPAVERTKGKPVEDTIKENVRLVRENLIKSPYFSKLLEDNKLLIVGGYYNFHTGMVEWL